MRTTLLALATGVALIAGASAASAMPTTLLAGADAPQVTLVAEGCGPGFHRGPYGGCRPFGGGFRPHFERQCFVRQTPYGPRRICR